MMLSISPLMTGLVMLIVPVSGLMMALIFGRSQKYFVSQQAQLGDQRPCGGRASPARR